MAIEDIKIVDPDGGAGFDYLTLEDWNTGEQAGLPALDRQATAKCRSTGGSADDTDGQFTLSGWVTNDECFIKIWTDPAEEYRHDGFYPESGNKYRFAHNSGFAYAFVVDQSHVRIDGIAIRNNASSNAPGCLDLSSPPVNSDVRISNNVLCTNNPAPTARELISFNLGSTATDHTFRFWNNILYNGRGGIGWNFEVAPITNHTFIAYNNTVIHTNLYGIRCQDSGPEVHCYVKNNLVFDTATADADYLLAAYATRNYTNNLGQDDFTGSQDNYTITTQLGTDLFNDYNNDDYHIKTGSDAIDQATDLSTDPDGQLSFSDDIDGDIRVAPWDCGADEIAAAGPSEVFTDLKSYLNQIDLERLTDLKSYLQLSNIEELTDLKSYLALLNIERLTDLKAYLNQLDIEQFTDLKSYLEAGKTVLTDLKSYLREIDITLLTDLKGYIAQEQTLDVSTDLKGYIWAIDEALTDLKGYIQRIDIELSTDLKGYTYQALEVFTDIKAYLNTIDNLVSGDLKGYLKTIDNLQLTDLKSYLYEAEEVFTDLKAYTAGTIGSLTDLKAYINQIGVLRLTDLRAHLVGAEQFPHVCLQSAGREKFKSAGREKFASARDRCPSERIIN